MNAGSIAINIGAATTPQTRTWKVRMQSLKYTGMTFRAKRLAARPTYVDFYLYALGQAWHFIETCATIQRLKNRMCKFFKFTKKSKAHP